MVISPDSVTAVTEISAPAGISPSAPEQIIWRGRERASGEFRCWDRRAAGQQKRSFRILLPPPRVRQPPPPLRPEGGESAWPAGQQERPSGAVSGFDPKVEPALKIAVPCGRPHGTL
jgi:hypothetical protein